MNAGTQNTGRHGLGAGQKVPFFKAGKELKELLNK